VVRPTVRINYSSTKMTILGFTSVGRCRSEQTLDSYSCLHIVLQVDGTPGANDMPGRIVFANNSADGASFTNRAYAD
jgi:hypothetical protein